jgi:protoporphyrinogen/coproporphyrinogen III oxidase
VVGWTRPANCSDSTLASPEYPPVNDSIAQKTVVVVGGGISGLSAAHRLTELDPGLNVVVLEAGQRAGGVLQTVHRDGFLIEQSADNFITNVPWAVDLCRRIGLGDQLISTRTEHRGALVVHRGRLVRVPEGFVLLASARLWPLVTTPILSPLGKLRLLAERFVPRRIESGDESLAAFARRRLGREAFERLVQPLIGGIYTADPEQLSLAATMPRFIEMERRWGSLIRAARSESTSKNDQESGARYGLFATLQSGLGTLVERLVEKLSPGSVRLDSPVKKIIRHADGSFVLDVHGQDSIPCDGVIVTAPAPQSAILLADVDEAIAQVLGKIQYAGTSIVTLAYRREQIGHALDGFGFVVPAIERRQILAGSFSSMKFDGRAPEGYVLLRIFIGGACQSELNTLQDDELRAIVTGELRQLLNARGEPLFSEVVRWPNAMPQYYLGHRERVAAIERGIERLRGLELAGNAYHGVGIPHCIHSGELAAERMVSTLNSGDRS